MRVNRQKNYLVSFNCEHFNGKRGNLKISDGGKTTLTIYSECMHLAFFCSVNKVNKMMICSIDEVTKVTLYGCSLAKIDNETINYVVDFAFIGSYVNTTMQVKTVKFYIENLTQLLLSDINSRSRLIHHIQLEENVSLTIKQENEDIKNITLTLEYDEYIAFNESTSNVSKVGAFFSFIANSSLSIYDVTCDILIDSGDIYTFNNYYQSTIFNKNIPNSRNIKSIISQDYLNNNIQVILREWVNLFTKIQSGINLFISVKNKDKKHLEDEFMALIQAVETVHRNTVNTTLLPQNDFNNLVNLLRDNCPVEHREWLLGCLKHGNELPLRKRLSELLNSFKDLGWSKKIRKSIISRSLKTRNYFTHFDLSLKEEKAIGYNLVNITTSIETVFIVSILSLLESNNAVLIEEIRASRTIMSKIEAVKLYFNNKRTR